MARYDIAIIGTGPAGLSAAITAKIRNKSILLIGSADLSAKVQKAHTIQNYLGLPAISGDSLQKSFLEHIQSMDISITDVHVNMIYSMGDYFMLQCGTEIMEASTVILATGVVQGKPYPGEEEYLGKGVSYCATCDAALYKGKTTAVIGFSPREEAEADFMAEYAETVYYIPMYPEEPQVKDGIKIIHEKPKMVSGSDFVEQLTTDVGSYAVDGVFFLRESISPSKLIPGIEVENNHIKVDRTMATNIPGCFACGDITGRPYQYIKSAGEGNVAALSAVSLIDERNRTNQ